MPEAPSLDIQELTGSQRRVTLRARNLPFQRPGWGGTQRVRTQWYAGNPVATIQVLGPAEEPTQFEGIWKDRFVSTTGFAQVVGFPEPALAEDLVGIFEALRRSGNALRVQWGAYVRDGVLTSFESRPLRAEDIEWTAEFTWFAVNGERAPRASGVSAPEPDVRAALNAVDDIFIFEPSFVLGEFTTGIFTRIASMRAQVGLLFDALRTARAVARVPLQAVGAALAAARSIRFEAEEIVSQLVDLPSEYARLTDRVVDAVRVDRWARTLARRSKELAARATLASERVRDQATPPLFQLVEAPANGSLRQVAFDVYGSADAWQTIADANGVVGSVVEPLTPLLIPPPAASGLGS